MRTSFLGVLLKAFCLGCAVMVAIVTRGGTVVQVFSGTNAGAVTLAVFNPALGKLVEARFNLTNAYTGPATYVWPYPQSATLLSYNFYQSLQLGLTLNSFAPQPTTLLNAFGKVYGPDRAANLPLVQGATFFVPPEAAGLTAGLAYAPGDFSGGQTALQTAFTTPPIHLGTETWGLIGSVTDPPAGDPQPQTPCPFTWSLTATYTYVPNAYFLWAQTNGLTGNAVLPSSDPDGDGLPNAVEAYFGLSPTQSSVLPKPIVLWSNAELILQWTAASDTHGIAVIPEWSDDLTMWRADVPGGGASLPLTNLGPGAQPNATRWETRVTTAGAPVRFLRLAIQVP